MRRCRLLLLLLLLLQPLTATSALSNPRRLIDKKRFSWSKESVDDLCVRASERFTTLPVAPPRGRSPFEVPADNLRSDAGPAGSAVSSLSTKEEDQQHKQPILHLLPWP